VKKISAVDFFRSRYFAALAAGLLLTCAFPIIDLAGFAWIAPGIMLGAALGTRGAEAFRIGYCAGLAHYLSMLYWLLLIPYRWHGLPLAPALGWLALSAVLALFIAGWVWLMAGLVATRSNLAEAEITSSPGFSAPLVRAAGTLPAAWANRLLWMITGGMTWVGLEMIMARMLGGFPWDLLGVSQYRMVPLIQVASVTGVYGLSFLVIWVSLSLLSAALMMVRRPTARSVWVAEMFVPVIVTAVVFNFGFRAINHAPAPERTMRVMLVQPSIPQTLIWDPGQDTNRFAQLVNYTDLVLTNKSDLVIWPESAIPTMIRYDTNAFDAITGLARKHGVWMILGSDDVEPRREPGESGRVYFNSSFLISPQGVLENRYIKRSLVIFGEYVPFQRWLPFMQWFTPLGDEGGFTPGSKPVEFRLSDLDVATSVLIWFEDTFPQLGRTDVRPDTDFLVNITNDGWFGESAAQWQQATTALFRAVENRRPLIRCCNNGVSCWIDAQGRMRDVLRDQRGTVYGLGYLQVEIPLKAAGNQSQLTFYTRHGDVFGWVCVAGAALALAWRIVQRRPRNQIPR
jgi:apolipoprotein N-acyltransferase